MIFSRPAPSVVYPRYPTCIFITTVRCWMIAFRERIPADSRECVVRIFRTRRVNLTTSTWRNMNFRNPPSNKYWIPYIYARPNYIILATPLGSKHVPLPLEDFLVAVAITVLSGIVLCCWLCPRRYCCCCCCCQRCSKKKQRHRTQRHQIQWRTTTAECLVLIITDGGTDVDGTLALCALKGLMQQQQVPLAGVVTSGGQLETRARIARGWLRRLGIADKMVSVAPGSRSKRAIRTTKEEEEEV